MPPKAPEGFYNYGKGQVCVLRHDPKEYVFAPGGDRLLLDAVEKVYGRLERKNSFRLDRGPYTIVAVMDESDASDQPLTLEGCFIDLFDPELPIVKVKTVCPGEQALLFDVARVSDKKRPQTLAAASRQYDERHTRHSYSFTAKSPINTSNVMRVLLPRRPKAVSIDGKDALAASQYDNHSRTLLLSFDNRPEGVRVEVLF